MFNSHKKRKKKKKKIPTSIRVNGSIQMFVSGFHYVECGLLIVLMLNSHKHKILTSGVRAVTLYKCLLVAPTM
jgi:hypothetical protein